MKKIFAYLFYKLTGRYDYLITTYNINEARKLGVKVGENCRFIGTSQKTFSTEPYLIEIGDHVSMSCPSFITHDGGVWIFRKQFPGIEYFGKIIIGNNVFIGINAIILPNTVVRENSIVAAGAVLKGEYPPDSVIAGVPGKVISSTSAYYEKNKEKFTFFRDLSPAEKRKRLMNHLF